MNQFIQYTGLEQAGPWILLVGTSVMTVAAWWCHLHRYPSFSGWSEADFVRQHARHSFQISIVVVPGMLLQIIGSLALHAAQTSSWLVGLCWVFLLASILPTLIISAPIHRRLSKGKKIEDIRLLLGTNLPRTLAWTGHLVVSVIWLIGEITR